MMKSTILPYLEQIKELEIHHGRVPQYSLNIELPLTHTLQRLTLSQSASSWMYGRTFKVLIEFHNDYSPILHDGLQIDLPACTTLDFIDCPMDYFRCLSCSNVQNIRLNDLSGQARFDLTRFKGLHDFLFTLSCLQNIYISVLHGLGMDSLIHFAFCDAREQGAWRDIRSVEAEIIFPLVPSEASAFFDQTVRHRPRYEKWWRTFTVTKKLANVVTLNASWTQ
jgi:hypothetical protein